MPLLPDSSFKHQVEYLMGAAFHRLAPALRHFHRLSGPIVLKGHVRTEGPTNALCRVMGRLLGTPLLSSDGPLRFGLAANAESTRWIRHFPCEVMTSSLRIVGAHLEERLGPARLSFVLQERAGALHLHLVRMRFWGVSCPDWLLPKVTAIETGYGSQLHFLIEARLPGFGLVTRYTGYIEVPGS